MYKFRGKRVDNGEWVYGDLHTIYGDEGKILRQYIFTSSYDLYWSYRELQVHPDSVGKWTGKKDTYSRDIITFLPLDRSTGIPQRAVIRYCEKRACFIAESTFWLIPLFKCLKIKVIGNTTDDKNLLENTK